MSLRAALCAAWQSPVCIQYEIASRRLAMTLLEGQPTRQRTQSLRGEFARLIERHIHNR